MKQYLYLYQQSKKPSEYVSIAACLQSGGQPMPLNGGAIPVLEVGTIVEALHLISIWAEPMTRPCIVLEQPLLLGVLHAHTTIGSDLLASIGGNASCLFLVGACSCFYSLDNVMALINCQLFSAVLLEASVLPEPVGSAHTVVVLSCGCCR